MKMTEETNTSMNEALRKWINETEEYIKSHPEKKDNLAKPTGKCQICGEKTAEFVCLKCETPVCKSCYFKLIGVCKKCVPAEIAGKWDGSQPDWEKELGIKWIE
jgi:hypothetical protein